MRKVIAAAIVLAVCLSSLVFASSKTCTKLKTTTYSVYKMDPLTQMLSPEIRTHSRVIFVCCEGYKEVQLTGDQVKCEPICKHPCGQGICAAPNICQCDPGFKQLWEGGSCLANELFETEESSNKPTPTVITEIVDPPANSVNLGHPFKPTKNESECEKCLQGQICISGICVCPSGYNLRPEVGCQPICEQSCSYGRCIAPNYCECVDGYTYDYESLQCRPLCNGKIYGCVHGTCVGHNQCRCDNGRVLQRDEQFECVAEVEKRNTSLELYLLLILIPAGVIAAGSIYIILRRWRDAQTNRMEAQDERLSEVRCNDPKSTHSLIEAPEPAPDCGTDEAIPMNQLGIIVKRGMY